MNLDSHTLSIDQLVRSDDPSIWVVNTSEGRSPDGAQFRVLIIAMVNNQPIPISIEKSWLPVNLANEVPKKTLLESNYFLKARTEGLIAVVDSQYAEMLNSRPGADQERRRLRELKEAVESASRAAGINVQVTDRTQPGASRDNVVASAREGTNQNRSFDMSSLGDAGEESSPLGLPQDEISTAFRALVMKLNAMTETDAISELRTRGKMNEANARYLATNIQHESIRKHVMRQLDN